MSRSHLKANKVSSGIQIKHVPQSCRDPNTLENLFSTSSPMEQCWEGSLLRGDQDPGDPGEWINDGISGLGLLLWKWFLIKDEFGLILPVSLFLFLSTSLAPFPSIMRGYSKKNLLDACHRILGPLASRTVRK
jgi:hypothetical protein